MKLTDLYVRSLSKSPLIVGTVKIWDLRMRNLQCQRIFQAGNIVNSVKLHPNQQEVLVGDAAGKYNFVSVCKLVIKLKPCQNKKGRKFVSTVPNFRPFLFYDCFKT